MGNEHETRTVVHRDALHRRLGSTRATTSDRHDVLRFDATSFEHEYEFVNVTAQHVVPRSQWRRKLFAKLAHATPGTDDVAPRQGLWRQSALQRDVVTTREHVDINSLVSAVVAWRGSGDDDPVMYVSFADSRGGTMSLPVVHPFERSTQWAPLLDGALRRSPVQLDETVTAVLKAWCEDRPYSTG